MNACRGGAGRVIRIACTFSWWHRTRDSTVRTMAIEKWFHEEEEEKRNKKMKEKTASNKPRCASWDS